MKKQCLLMPLLCSFLCFSTAYAEEEVIDVTQEIEADQPQQAEGPLSALVEGLYLSASVGAADVDGGGAYKRNVQEVPDQDTKEQHVAIQFLVGYQFNKYFATELGFLHLPDHVHDGVFFTDSTKRTVASLRQIRLEDNRVFDLAAKFMLPMDRFVFFAKAGAGLVHTEGKFRSVFTFTPQHNRDLSDSQNVVRPIYSLGASYKVKEQMTLDLTFKHVISWDSHDICCTFDNTINDSHFKTAVPTSRALTLGLTAYFG